MTARPALHLIVNQHVQFSRFRVRDSGFGFTGSGLRATRCWCLDLALPGVRQDVKQRRAHHTQSVYGVNLQKSVPAPIRQLTLNIGTNKGQVYEFLREFTFAKRRSKQVCEMKTRNRDELILTAASERRRNYSKGSEASYLKAKARIWP